MAEQAARAVAKRSFATMLETQDKTHSPIDLDAKQEHRVFMQESIVAPANTQALSIIHAQKERKIRIEEKHPHDHRETILLEIARLSREWDYLDYCELLTALHVAMIKDEKDKVTDLQIKILRHPLHKEACFLKNESEYNLLGKMITK